MRRLRIFKERIMKINGVYFKPITPEPCGRLVQFFKGLPITCGCTRCAAKGQTPEQARAAVEAAHAS